MEENLGNNNLTDQSKNDLEPKRKGFSKLKLKISLLNVLLLLFSVLYIATIFISFKVINTRNEVFPYKKSGRISKNKIVVIPIYGTIYKKEYFAYEKGSDLIVSMIKKYGEDKDVKAIVLDINSPGGSIGAVQEIYSQIKKIKEKYKKPFVAHFGDVSASGGYYIACACDKIVANNGSITGSIGVIFSFMQGDELFKKIGIKNNVIKSGKFKDIGSFAREMTKEEREILQAMIDDTYNTFIEVVSQGRNIPKEKVKEIADGRIFTGKQALSVGLVDKIGDLYDALNEAGKLCGLGENPSFIRAKSSFLDEFFSVIDSKLSFFKSEPSYPLLEYRWSY
jgi:protease-4